MVHATEEILLILALTRTTAAHLSVPVAVGIAGHLLVVVNVAFDLEA